MNSSSMINSLFRSVVYKSMEAIPNINASFGVRSVQILFSGNDTPDLTIVIGGIHIPVYSVKLAEYDEKSREKAIHEGTIALTDAGIQYCFEGEAIEDLIKKALEWGTPTVKESIYKDLQKKVVKDWNL